MDVCLSLWVDCVDVWESQMVNLCLRNVQSFSRVPGSWSASDGPWNTTDLEVVKTKSFSVIADIQSFSVRVRVADIQFCSTISPGSCFLSTKNSA